MARRASRSGTYLGVDIGSAMIKAVELGTRSGQSAGGDGMVLKAMGAIPTPAGAVQEGRITDPQAVGRTIRDLLARSGIRTRQAVASVNGQVAIVREIRLPNLPPAELKQAARFEVERYLPYPIAEVTYDTFVMGEMKESGTSRLDVLVVAARTDVLNQHVAALRAAGLEPLVLDVELFALARAMTEAGVAPAEQVVIYIHIGAETTAIEIVSGGLPRVMRSVAFGGSTITRLLAERLGVEPDKAEGIKMEASAAGGSDEPRAVQLREVVMAGLPDLTTEVRRSLDYYGGRFRGAVPERAVVTGGGALLPGLTQYLSTDLDIPVEVGDPFLDLAAPGSDTAMASNRQSSAGPFAPPAGSAGALPGPALAIAVGLARRGVEES